MNPGAFLIFSNCSELLTLASEMLVDGGSSRDSTALSCDAGPANLSSLPATLSARKSRVGCDEYLAAPGQPRRQSAAVRPFPVPAQEAHSVLVDVRSGLPLGLTQMSPENSSVTTYLQSPDRVQ